jgi:hypothetical protein
MPTTHADSSIWSQLDTSQPKLSPRQYSDPNNSCNSYGDNNCDFSNSDPPSSSSSNALPTFAYILIAIAALMGLLILGTCFRHLVAHQNTLTPRPRRLPRATAPPPIPRSDVLDLPLACAPPASLPMRTVEQVYSSVGEDLVRRVARAPGYAGLVEPARLPGAAKAANVAEL